MKEFLQPKSVAVIGASSHPEKVGFAVLKNIIDGKYPGKIYPVNPHIDNIIGLKCYPGITDLPKRIELAVIVIPAVEVAAALTDCGKQGIRNVIIISAGFSEDGPDGKAREASIKKIAAAYRIRVLGPNCLGVIDPVNHFNASFATSMPEKRNIAVISQSGATVTAILDWANGNGVGFSHFISLGNKADLNECDFLEYFENDKDTKVVIGYLESVSEPERFLELARRITRKKPVIILKAGRSAEGSEAAGSHTGALAVNDEVLTTAFNEAGVIRAETLEDLFELATVFSDMSLPKSDNLLVITNAGGPGVMSADSIAADQDLSFFELSDGQKEVLSKTLPLGAAVENPIDLLGDADSRRFENVFKLLRGKNDSDLKLVIITPQSGTDAENIAGVISKHSRQDTAVVLLGGPMLAGAKKILADHKICTFLYPERAISALGKLARYSKYTHQKAKIETYTKVNKGVAGRVLGAYKLLDEADIAKAFMAYGIPMAGSKLTTNANEAIKAADGIGYPVVLKVTSPDILHKTEIGAIKLGVENDEELRRSYQEVLKNAKKHHPKARILGVTVYKMVRSTVEVALGAKKDPLFGPVVMFGLGGIYIELFKDFKLGLAPVSIEKAKQMISGIRYVELLRGYRNGEKFDIDALAMAVSGLSQLMIDFPQLREVDINPIRVNTENKGILALDAKIIFEPAGPNRDKLSKRK